MAGRPREFDVDTALENAMRVFWEKGYEGTSMSDLTSAMDINPPSLYAAFGGKEALFYKALDRYAGGPATYVARAIAAPTARTVAEKLLTGAVELYCGKGNPGGCLGVKGGLASSDDAAPVRRELAERRIGGEKAVALRLKKAAADGNAMPEGNPADLSRHLWAVVYGMGVQSTAGAGRKELSKIVEITLRGWPEHE